MKNILSGSNERFGRFFYALSDIGTTRSSNQDSVYAKLMKTPAGIAFMGIVCDGMGGLSYGELASETVTKIFSEWFEQEFRYLMNTDELAESLKNQWDFLVETAQNDVYSRGIQMGAQMGTTLSLLLLICGKYYALQIGDSRIYKICGGKPELITTDHSCVMDKVSSGLMTFDEACLSKEKNVLTRCIGVGEYFKADFYEGESLDGDCFLMSSDGFHGGMTADGMCSLLTELCGLSRRGVKSRLEAAIEQKKSGGEKDNISAIFVKLEE